MPIAKEVAWDFEKNIPIWQGGEPVIVQGIYAVLVWAYKALQTERTRYIIYTWDYGNEISTLTGSDYPDGLKKSEAQRFIKECLEISDYITEVKDIKVEFENNKISISCTIVSVYGEVKLSV